MFSKAVYSKLEFSAPTSRKKVFKLQNFFPECACVSHDAKKIKIKYSFEWCRSGHFWSHS